jgi:hypothetical protein
MNNSKLIILSVGILFFITIPQSYTSYNLSSKFELIKNNQQNLISAGIWVNALDSTAHVQINDNHWIFIHDQSISDTNDVFDYEITEEATNDKNEIIDGFLTLNNGKYSLEYGIDLISERNMTLVYLARGNSHHYIKKN